MAQSVKLADDVMSLVRREAELQSRSVAGQIAHWIKIGRAIERSSAFDYSRIKQALEGAGSTRPNSKRVKRPPGWTSSPTRWLNRRQMNKSSSLSAGCWAAESGWMLAATSSTRKMT